MDEIWNIECEKVSIGGWSFSAENWDVLGNGRIWDLEYGMLGVSMGGWVKLHPLKIGMFCQKTWKEDTTQKT